MTAARARLTALLCAALALLAVAPAAQAAYRVTAAWGSEGQGSGQFGSGILGGGSFRQYDDPAGIAIARNGSVLVVDTSNNRVQRFSKSGRYLGRFGRRGLDSGFVKVTLTDRFFQPEGMAVDPGGSIFVADAGNDRVMKFAAGGRFRKRLAKHGSSAGEVVQPWGVAAARGRVWVIDQGNYRILRFTTGGRYLGAFGHFGRDESGFVTPYGIAAAAGGQALYVADIIRHRILVFTPSGRYLFGFGGPGRGNGRFLKPAGVAVGPDGTVFVSDRCNHRVERFTADGHWLETLGHGALGAPTFLTVDRSGDVFVSDYHRVVRFSTRAGGAVAVPSHHNGIDITCRHVAELNGVG